MQRCHVNGNVHVADAWGGRSRRGGGSMEDEDGDIHFVGDHNVEVKDGKDDGG